MFDANAHITHGRYIEIKGSADQGYNLFSMYQSLRCFILLPASKRRFLAIVREIRTNNQHLTSKTIYAEIQHLLTANSGQKEQSVAALYGVISTYCEHMSGTVFGADNDLSAWALFQGGVCERTSNADLDVITAVSAVLAMVGHSLHIVCSDDRSARHAYNYALPLLSILKIQTACIERRTSSAKRKIIYQKTVVFSAASEIIMDHLRDQVVSGGKINETRSLLGELAGKQVTGIQKTTNGLTHALVFEGENLLCDTALTSIMVNETVSAGVESNLPYEALGLAWQMSASRDFELENNIVRFTRRGLQRASMLTRSMGDRWSQPARSEFMILRALEALNIWKLGRDYTIDGEELQAINVELEDRLQQDIETPALAQFLAACAGRSSAVTGKAAARITFRRFFKRYSKVSAFVQDVQLCQKELYEAYGMRSFEPALTQAYKRRDIQVSFHEEKFQRNLNAVRQKCRSPVHVIETRDEKDAMRTATSINRTIHETYTAKCSEKFDPVLHCIWIQDVDQLAEELSGRNILSTDKQLVFITLGMDNGIFLRALTYEWRYFWLVKMSVRDFEGKLNSEYYRFLACYANSGFPGAIAIGRWLRRYVMKKHADETQKIRKSLVKLDNQYRNMISFAGSGD